MTPWESFPLWCPYNDEDSFLIEFKFLKSGNYETSKDLIDAHFVSSSPEYTDEFEGSFTKVGNV